jgi:hypothetical protein
VSESNGTTENRIADLLQDEVTVGYRPVLPLETLWLSGGDMPQLTLRRDIEFMQLHPVVMTAMEYYKSGINGAEFWGGPDHANQGNPMGKPISADHRVAQFVMALCDRYWQRGVPLIQEGAYPYGWGPGEHIYKEVNGMLVWSHLKSFHPNDAHILHLKWQPVGVRIKNIKDKEPVDLWLGDDKIPSKAAWYPHRPRFNQLYGRSQLTGAWRPWRRLGWRDAVEQVIDAAVYRAGYRGPLIKFPPGHSAPTATQGIPATTRDGGGLPRRENRDVARQTGEYAKAGATMALSSEVYPNSNTPKWSVEWPDHVMDVRPLIEAARYLEDQIMLGIGVPPELVKAGGTGSGYSGRSIPREAFLDGQQKVADALLQNFIEQVVRPLVLWNFGDIPFEVSCKSLLHSQTMAAQGEGGDNTGKDFKRSQAAKDAWQIRKQNEGAKHEAPASQSAPSPTVPAVAPPPTSPAPTLSLEARDKVLSIVQRVLKRRAG